MDWNILTILNVMGIVKNYLSWGWSNAHTGAVSHLSTFMELGLRLIAGGRRHGLPALALALGKKDAYFRMPTESKQECNGTKDQRATNSFCR